MLGVLVMMVLLSTSVTALSPAPEVDCCYSFINDGSMREGCSFYVEEPKEKFCVQVLKEWNETIRAIALSAIDCCYDRLELGDAIDPGCYLAVGDFSYCATLIAENEAREDEYDYDEYGKDFIIGMIILIGVPILVLILIIAVIWLAVRNHQLKKLKKGKSKRKKRKR